MNKLNGPEQCLYQFSAITHMSMALLRNGWINDGKPAFLSVTVTEPYKYQDRWYGNRKNIPPVPVTGINIPVTVTGKNIHFIPVTGMNTLADPVTVTGILARLAVNIGGVALYVKSMSDSSNMALSDSGWFMAARGKYVNDENL
ncbi:hypothetical protein [Nitrosovibrio tenuis]|uniref:Uncharacterized protein n=1 Tax=Nitrosovibrio tenuis TaxID=1233 RepID=A0A1H7PAV9_9PROT|nr:hypothetical protein [Nitrosovibrio tenuis]SEL32227.1 hypothetical protein SAMN05216387_10896 [Nitrosovibrio tenuis]